MNTYPTKMQLSGLEAYTFDNCVTIYMPLTPHDSNTNPNIIRLKNHLKEAARVLNTHDLNPRVVKATLQAGNNLINNQDLYANSPTTLALFMHENNSGYYLLPDDTITEQMYIQEGFDTTPIEQSMAANKSYYVLALSHNHIGLYKGDAHSLFAMPLDDFPLSMKEELKIDEYPSGRETHPIAPANMGKAARGYHSQYDVSITDKKMLTTFFGNIDKRIKGLLDGKAPLMIAGVGYLLPIYQAVNTYPKLLPKAIVGNFDRTQLNDLQQLASALLLKVA